MGKKLIRSHDQPVKQIFRSRRLGLLVMGLWLGLGTGLGASTLVKVGDSFKALQAEGGHTHFSPTNKIELDLLIWLQNKFQSF